MQNKADADDAVTAAMNEIVRIEARYSRYRADSELSRINQIGTIGGTVYVDSETAGLLNYAYACFRKSDGLFDITSGLLRKAWDFSSARLPDQKAIAALLPRIGLGKIAWDDPCEQAPKSAPSPARWINSLWRRSASEPHAD